MDKEKSRMSWEDFSQAYCATQVSDPESLANALAEKVDTYHPDGFMLLRCEVLDSSRLGQMEAAKAWVASRIGSQKWVRNGIGDYVVERTNKRFPLEKRPK